jgi:hypothetical protein
VPILAVVKAVANHLFEEYNQHEGITDEPGVGPPPATPGVSDAPAAQNRAEAEAGGSPTRGSGDPPPHT